MIVNANDCAEFSGTLTCYLPEVCLDELSEPDTLYIFITRGEHRIRESINEAFGNIRRVVINVDGEQHEYDADALIELLEELEVYDDSLEKPQ